LVLLIIAHTLSSTQLEIREKQFLPGIKRVESRGRGGRGKGRGQEEGGKNDPNIV
jgi:hypothetical protein